MNVRLETEDYWKEFLDKIEEFDDLLSMYSIQEELYNVDNNNDIRNGKYTGFDEHPG